MVISRTPFRVSFFGGGTDYPEWYRRHGGAVLATTINKYCYISCRYLPPFFEHRFRIVYIKSENCKAIDEISHPVVRGVLQHLEWTRGLEVHHDADLPARGGVGSSSSFTVGMLNALAALRGGIISKRDLALESLHMEQEVLKETVGSQDQISAAYGGLNHIRFHESGDFSVHPVTILASRSRELEGSLMLFYTGIKRTAAVVAGSFVPSLASRLDVMPRIGALVEEGIDVLQGNGDIGEFGKLLDKGWELKRTLSARVSNDDVDHLYARARSAGAVGGKILGAGGGGFMLFFVPPPRQAAFREALGDLIHVPFKFDYSGSQIVYYDPDEDFSETERDLHGRVTRPVVDQA